MEQVNGMVIWPMEEGNSDSFTQHRCPKFCISDRAKPDCLWFIKKLLNIVCETENPRISVTLWPGWLWKGHPELQVHLHLSAGVPCSRSYSAPTLFPLPSSYQKRIYSFSWLLPSMWLYATCLNKLLKTVLNASMPVSNKPQLYWWVKR